MLHLALSQAEYGHAILQDIGLICVVAVLLAGALHHFVRKSAAGLRWNQMGKVSTAGFGIVDIFACLFVCSPFALTLLFPYAESSGEMSVLTLVINFGVLLMMGAVVVFVFQQRDMLPEALGLKPKQPVMVISWAILAYIIFFILTIVLSQLGLEEWLADRLGEKQVQAVVNELIGADQVQKKLTLIIGACVIAPLAEEVVFRGYLYPVVKRFTDPVVAALFSGVIFGAIHGNIWAMIPLSLFGILLGVLYERSGSIWSCILCHSMFNSINVVFMLTMGDQL